jgi:hypothetical protein
MFANSVFILFPRVLIDVTAAALLSMLKSAQNTIEPAPYDSTLKTLA